jgi:hypothetical protein
VIPNRFHLARHDPPAADPFGAAIMSDLSHESPETGNGDSPAHPYLELPKSLLAVDEGVLFKRTPDGGVIARHPLKSVDGVTVETVFDSFSLVIDLFGGALLWAGWNWLEPGWAQWILMGVGALALLMGLIGAFGNRLVVVYKGERIEYTVTDEDDAAAGFARSVRDLLEGGSGL